MQTEQAEHTLETIRTLMERSQCYEHISGYAGLLAGGATMIGGLILEGHWLSLGPFWNFFAVWSSVFLISCTGHLLLTFARARQRDEPVWTRQAKTVYLAVLPCCLAGAAVTIGMASAGRLHWLPTVWLISYGCGILATRYFAPPSITWLGGMCLAIGLLSLFVPLGALLTMTAGFGLTHLGFGVCVLIAEYRAARQQAFWREVQHLAEIE